MRRLHHTDESAAWPHRFHAPKACFDVKHSHDASVHAGNLAAWDQHYEQTSPGRFQGVVHELLFPDIQVFVETATRATSQHCRTWADGVWLGLPVQPDPDGLRFMGQPVQGQQLMVAYGSAPFDLQVPADCGLYGLVFDRRLLADHLASQHHLQWHQPLPDAPCVQPLTLAQRSRLAGLMRQVLDSLAHQPDVLVHTASRHALREVLLTLLTQTLMPQALQTLGRPSLHRRLDLVRKVREFVLDQPGEAWSVDQLCSHFHVTRRTLQNSFQAAVGMSPAAYLRTTRLNAVRHALQQARSHATVADIAARWGFWHMGHFAHDYKQLFGETPSQTREATRRVK